jgi:hypothetical protein
MTATKMIYTVMTRDVDGRSQRQYRTLKGAIKRFEEMYGHPMGTAIDEQFYALADQGKPLPLIEDLMSLRAVSSFGTVVTFQAAVDYDRMEAAPAPVAPADDEIDLGDVYAKIDDKMATEKADAEAKRAANFAEIVESYESCIAEETAALARVEVFPPMCEYVIKTGHAYIVFEDGAVSPRGSFGVKHATRFTKAHAERLAPTVRDGNGVQGKALRIADALRESIADAQKGLADLRARWDARTSVLA